FSCITAPPIPTLFPYTTLFRSHFENLGIYELVRRRCKVIVASDVSQDPLYGGAELRNAIERCRVDFGVEIYIDLSNFKPVGDPRSEEHTSELQSRENLVCRLLL